MKKHGKNYVEASKSLEKNKVYSKDEAIKLLKEISKRKFDETVDVAFKLNIDAKKTDMNVRSSIVLPHGTGKTKKVLVLTKSMVKEANEAGADYVGGEELIEKISKESWFDFDAIVATPDIMVPLGKIGKILGPKGLMPNPKLGTVTNNVKVAVTNIKKGQVEFKNDSFGNVHAIIGKLSFDEKSLDENFIALYREVVKNKPTTAKGEFIKNISISSTMSPGLKVDKNSFDK
ncbi:MAG: 50S ribosomal protein L1 [Bacilli bacterium]